MKIEQEIKDEIKHFEELLDHEKEQTNIWYFNPNTRHHLHGNVRYYEGCVDALKGCLRKLKEEELSETKIMKMLLKRG